MKRPIYAALDLHSRHSVLGSMDHEGNNEPRIRFATTAEMLRSHVAALRQKKRPVYLTMEAGAFTRWVVGSCERWWSGSLFANRGITD